MYITDDFYTWTFEFFPLFIFAYASHTLALDEVGIDISNHVGAFMSKADLGVRMQGKP
jgi:hypothetical protein